MGTDKEKIRRMVQLKINHTDQEYESHIDDIIEVAWSYLAKLQDWWFLEQGTPIEINLISGQGDYLVNKENVGQLLYIASSNGRRIWDYKSRRNFLKYQDSGPGRIYWTDNDDLLSGQTSVFTTAGLKSGKMVIRLHLKPNDSQVANTGNVFLHWKEAGTLGNLNKLPVAWTKVLLHLIGTMIEPPHEFNKNMFKAMVKHEEELFRLSFDDMVRMEAPADNDVDEYDFDDLNQSRLDEVNQTL